VTCAGACAGLVFEVACAGLVFELAFEAFFKCRLQPTQYLTYTVGFGFVLRRARAGPMHRVVCFAAVLRWRGPHVCASQSLRVPDALVVVCFVAALRCQSRGNGSPECQCLRNAFTFMMYDFLTDRRSFLWSGLGGPGRPGNLVKRLGASPPILWKGLLSARGRPNPIKSAMSGRSTNHILKIQAYNVASSRSGSRNRIQVAARSQVEGLLTERSSWQLPPFLLVFWSLETRVSVASRPSIFGCVRLQTPPTVCRAKGCRTLVLHTVGGVWNRTQPKIEDKLAAETFVS